MRRINFKSDAKESFDPLCQAFVPLLSDVDREIAKAKQMKTWIGKSTSEVVLLQRIPEVRESVKLMM